MADETLPSGEDVDVVDFDAFLDEGNIGGDVTAKEGEEVGKAVDGVPVQNVTDTRNIVADDVESYEGLDDPPGGENV